MPSRRNSPPSKPSRSRALERSHHEPGPVTQRRVNNRSTKRWRRDTRPRAIRAAVSATKALRWSSTLIDALLEELYVDDRFAELLGSAPSELRVREYPQATALALILRHSWHPDDLACMVQRLGLKVKGVGSL